VITFTENPKKFFFPETYEGDILSPQQKMEIFGTLGVERVILIDFSLEFSKIKGGEFLQILQDRWHPVFMALGDNFRWGRHRDMDAGSIQRANRAKGIPTEIIPPVEIEGAPVSSSRIRAAILGGDLGLAERLLGRPWVPGTLAGPGRCLN
jgi:riboflavin kinase/FMN adenylyltransferase